LAGEGFDKRLIEDVDLMSKPTTIFLEVECNTVTT
jgi:hypothetical protein